jgi:hypothetical protein
MGSVGELTDMAGALLLFATNFMSIQVTGIIIMYAYKVHQMALRPNARRFRNIFIVLIILLGFVGVPLGFTSKRIAVELETQDCVKEVTDEFLSPHGWECNVVIARSNGNKLEAKIAASGPPPIPQLVFPEGPTTSMVEEVDGWPFINALNERCPKVDV